MTSHRSVLPSLLLVACAATPPHPTNPATTPVAATDDRPPPLRWFAFTQKGQCGFRDAQLATVVPATFESCATLEVGDQLLPIVRVDGKWGRLTRDGKLASAAIYDRIYVVSEHMPRTLGLVALVGKDEQRVETSDGRVLMKGAIGTIDFAAEDYVLVSVDGRRGARSMTGELLVPVVHDGIAQLGAVEPTLLRTYIGKPLEQPSIHTLDGRRILHLERGFVRRHGDVLEVADGPNRALYDLNGKELVPSGAHNILIPQDVATYVYKSEDVAGLVAGGKRRVVDSAEVDPKSVVASGAGLGYFATGRDGRTHLYGPDGTRVADLAVDGLRRGPNRTLVTQSGSAGDGQTRFGLVTAEGEVLVPPTYRQMKWRGPSSCLIAQKGYDWAVLSDRGAPLSSFAFRGLTPVNGSTADGLGLFIAKKRGRYAVVRCDGKVLTREDYFDIQLKAKNEPLFVVEGAKGKGLLDADGNLLVPPEYASVDVMDDFIRIEAMGKYGLVDRKGRQVLAPKYDAISVLSRDRFTTRVDGRTTLRAEDGRVLGEPFERILQMLDRTRRRPRKNDTFLVVERAGRRGAVNFDGELVAPPEYDRVDVVRFGVIAKNAEGSHLFAPDGRKVNDAPCNTIVSTGGGLFTCDRADGTTELDAAAP